MFDFRSDRIRYYLIRVTSISHDEVEVRFEKFDSFNEIKGWINGRLLHQASQIQCIKIHVKSKLCRNSCEWMREISAHNSIESSETMRQSTIIRILQVLRVFGRLYNSKGEQREVSKVICKLCFEKKSELCGYGKGIDTDTLLNHLSQERPGEFRSQCWISLLFSNHHGKAGAQKPAAEDLDGIHRESSSRFCTF